MKVVNLHEFEELAKKKVSVQAYNYIAAGAADELTLKANRERVRRFLGAAQGDGGRQPNRHDRRTAGPEARTPDPARTGRLADADESRRRAADCPGGGSHQVRYGGCEPAVVQEVAKDRIRRRCGGPRRSDTARSRRRRTWAKRSEELGATALCVTVDYPYTGARDRPSRDKWESEFARTRVFSTAGGSIQFQPGMLDPYTPELTWTWIKWARSASKLPIVVKGVLTAEDAQPLRREWRACGCRVQPRRPHARRYGRHASRSGGSRRCGERQSARARGRRRQTRRRHRQGAGARRQGDSHRPAVSVGPWLRLVRKACSVSSSCCTAS